MQGTVSFVLRVEAQERDGDRSALPEVRSGFEDIIWGGSEGLFPSSRWAMRSQVVLAGASWRRGLVSGRQMLHHSEGQLSSGQNWPNMERTALRGRECPHLWGGVVLG